MRPHGKRFEVQADSSHQYYSYFLQGMAGPITFSSKDFPELAGPRDGMAVRCPDGRRLFLAADDSSELNQEALDWADVYGKVNLHPDSPKSQREGLLVPIGPTFGIRYGSLVGTLGNSAKAWAAGGTSFAGLAPRMKAALRHWGQRDHLDKFTPRGESESRYLFLAATYWVNHPADNAERVVAYEELKRVPGLDIEGGLVPNGPHDLPDHLVGPSWEFDQYVERLGRSVIAVNTHGVHGCLGWKLGEFLAFGKAIVTTPPRHVMPGDFLHGEQAHFVSGAPGSWARALSEIVENPGYRRHLEAGSRRYFEQHVAPTAVIHRLTG